MGNTSPRLRMKAELDQADQEIALLREQMGTQTGSLAFIMDRRLLQKNHAPQAYQEADAITCREATWHRASGPLHLS